MMILKVSLVLGCLTTLALSTKSGRIGSPKTMARIRASEDNGLDSDEELKLIAYDEAHALKLGDRIEVDYNQDNATWVPATYMGNRPNNFGRVILDMNANQPEEQKTYEPDQGTVIHKTRIRVPSKFSISRKAALMCNLVKNITEGDPTAKEIEIRMVPGPILSKIVEYLKHHDGKAPAGTNFPTGPNFPICSCEMEVLVEDPWDAEFINKQTPNVIFQMILGANYMHIPSLLHLGCTKIATLIKGKSPLEIQMFFAAQNRLPAGLIATIASYVVYNVNKRRDAYDLCNAMGLEEEEISSFLRAGMFAEAERWDRFDDTDKGRNMTLSNDNRTASRPGVVRASKLVPREGHASATVRVDRVASWTGLGLEIGVIGVPGRDYNWSTANLGRNTNISSWCYDNYGDIYGKGCLLSKDNGMFDIPELTEGSEVTVTLTGGTVTFAHNGTDVHTLELPENCGPISLAVNIYGNGQVTLL